MKSTASIEYERNDVYRLMSWFELTKVQAAKVMVVGAGAVGNEVLKNLALLNVGNVFIVDFDHIEASNLSRSVLFRESDCIGNRPKSEVVAARIKELNPKVKTFSINGDILTDVGLGVFRRMDVIIGCLDNRLARLAINWACYKVNKYWIDAGVGELSGQVDVYCPGESCYECQLSPEIMHQIQIRLGCPDIAQRNISMGRTPTTSISASIVAAIQVQEALKVVHGFKHKLRTGTRFYFDGMNNEIMQYQTTPLKEDCLSHFTYDTIVESPFSANDTIESFLNWVCQYFEYENPVIELDFPVVSKIGNSVSNKTFNVLRGKPFFSESYFTQFKEDYNDVIYFIEEQKYINKQFPYISATLSAIGIPKLHILKIHIKGSYHFVELSKDEDFLQFQ